LELPQTEIIYVLPASILCILLGGFLFSVVQGIDFSQLSSSPSKRISNLSSAQELGILNLTQYLVVFEGISFFLLIALIGAAYIARSRE
ncbi:MAG: NADH-quinone oxidoreductase subunit J, partial [Bacteroidia bacterium]|nr:NADH-quinone oxidoreductase subunit J [Bacteroidia bacterium]MDW8157374.1 NADH-quinone oxidoreductase subunit J [Bacteroidia bacterium]